MDISRPFDRLTKFTAERDPRGLLHVVDALPIDAEAVVTPVDRELVVESMMVDNLYRIDTAERAWMVQVEMQTEWQRTVPERLARYGGAGAMKFDMEYEIVLVLLSPDRCPAVVPTRGEFWRRPVRITVDYQVVKIWELDPSWIVESNRIDLLPMVAGMNSPGAALAEAAERIDRTGDDSLQVDFRTFGRLRYSGDEAFTAILERYMSPDVMERIRKEIGFQNPIKAREEGLAEGRAEGLEQGLEKGLEQGRIEEAVRAVQQVLGARFPALASSPGLFDIHDIDRLHELLANILQADSVEAAQAAIDSSQK